MSTKEQSKKEVRVDEITYKKLNLVQRALRRLVKISASGLMHILFGMRCVGKENVPRRGPALIISNHTHFFDIPAVFWKVHEWIYFLAKKELFAEGFPRFVLTRWEAIPIDRDNPGMCSIRSIMNHLRDDHLVAIFPEGTRLKDPSERATHPPKAGIVRFATKLNVPVVPVSIHGRFGFRSGVRIVYGRPFFLRPMPKGASRAEVQQVADRLMDHIYELGEHPDTAVPDPSIALTPEELTDQQREELSLLGEKRKKA